MNWTIGKDDNPYRILAVTMAIIFTAEWVVMGILDLLAPGSKPAAAVLDAFMLTLLVAPAIYLFLFRPMVRSFASRAALEESLRRLEWLLSGRGGEASYASPYGDLLALNAPGLIRSAVGTARLADIAREYLDLMGSSSAIYEKNGDYALGIFSSGWCRRIDAASRSSCGTEDNQEALRCGKWGCHESCWAAAKTAIATGRPSDIECFGGIRLYAVPITAGGETVGAMNFGYGSPPRGDRALAELSRKCGVPVQELRKTSESYEFRPPFIVDLAKERLEASARMIGAIVEAKRAQESTQRAGIRYRRLFEAATDGILILDSSTGEILDVNPAMTALCACPAEELLGKKLWDLGLFKDDGAGKAHFKELRSLPHSSYDEMSLACKDGRTLDVACVSRLYSVDGGKVIQYNVRDVAELKRLQAQLLQSQKMESVGRLAGGVAHDFNNILMTILGNCDFVLGGLGTQDPRRGDVLEIQRAAERAAALTRQLLLFSRKEAGHPVPTGIDALIRNLEKMLSRVVKENITLELSLGAESGFALIDPGQIEQAILNLVVNARDAMPRGGRLTLRTALLGAGACLPKCDGGAREGCVRIEVEDTGCGMSPEVLQHLFEPFFTTKPAGQGTGLGLATLYGIVGRSRGDVAARSVVGQGSTFTIDLPLCARAPAVPAPAAVPAEPRRGRETILVVEDEETLRHLNARVLSACGYAILSARDAEEALGILRDTRNAVDLLLTDAIMPGMSGVELAKEAVLLRPDLKVALITGYCDLPDRVGSPLREVLRKPLTPQVLTRRVREILDQPASL